jgi:hypothetical protein
MATLVVLIFGLWACDEAVTDLADDTVGQEGAVADVDGLLAGVTEGLSLTSGQTAAVNELAASFGARIGEPGALWRLAPRLVTAWAGLATVREVGRRGSCRM